MCAADCPPVTHRAELKKASDVLVACACEAQHENHGVCAASYNHASLPTARKTCVSPAKRSALRDTHWDLEDLQRLLADGEEGSPSKALETIHFKEALRACCPRIPQTTVVNIGNEKYTNMSKPDS